MLAQVTKESERLKETKAALEVWKAEEVKKLKRERRLMERQVQLLRTL